MLGSEFCWLALIWDTFQTLACVNSDSRLLDPDLLRVERTFFSDSEKPKKFLLG